MEPLAIYYGWYGGRNVTNLRTHKDPDGRALLSAPRCGQVAEGSERP